MRTLLILMLIGRGIEDYDHPDNQALRACAAVAVGPVANAVRVDDEAHQDLRRLIMTGWPASVLLVHLSLFLTLLMSASIALTFTKPKPKKVDA